MPVAAAESVAVKVVVPTLSATVLCDAEMLTLGTPTASLSEIVIVAEVGVPKVAPVGVPKVAMIVSDDSVAASSITVTVMVLVVTPAANENELGLTE